MAKVDVANKALIYLGEQTITSFNDSNDAARTMKILYDSTKRFLLRSHNWGFAKQRKTLTKLGGHSDTRWQYAYAYPSDCLKVWSADGDCTKWERFGDQIWSNTDPFTIEYSKEVDEALFCPAFEKAFQYYLAAEVAMALSGSSTVRDKCEQKYLQAIVEAIEASDLEVGDQEFEEYPGEYLRRGMSGGIFTRDS